MNVMQYAVNDYAEFTLNVFTDKGLMDIRKLVWDKITVFKTPNEDFLYYSNENILKREIVDFDMSRYCEMELCKGKEVFDNIANHGYMPEKKVVNIIFTLHFY